MKDFSKEHSFYLKRLKRKNISITLLRWGILVVFIGVWELFAYLKIIDSFITSSPSRVFKTFIQLCQSGDIAKHIGITLGETVVSFLLTTVFGLIFAVVLWWFENFRKVLEPHIIILNALPKIALGPIIIIWVGAGQGAIITMSLMISLIITILNILGGLLSVDKNKIMLMRTLNASKWQILTKLVLPSNIPTIIDALKINVGLCWVGTIMGEYLVSSAGLGYLIIYGGQIFKLDLVMTSTIVLCLLAGIMYFCVELVEKLVRKKLNI